MSRMVTIFIFVLAIFILFDPTLRSAFGTAVGYGLEPSGLFRPSPIVTLVLVGLLMAGLTILVRHFFTDYVEQARSQKIVTAFNKELREARKENNSFKTKKLMAEQPKILQKSMAADHDPVQAVAGVDDHRHPDIRLGLGVRRRVARCEPRGSTCPCCTTACPGRTSPISTTHHSCSPSGSWCTRWSAYRSDRCYPERSGTSRSRSA